ncbi:unnamed protein product [Sphagnum tenellum]
MLPSRIARENLTMTNHSPLPPLSGDFTESLSGDSSATEYLPNMEELEEISPNSSPCKNFEKRIAMTQIRPKPSTIGRVAHTSAVTTSVTKSTSYQMATTQPQSMQSPMYVGPPQFEANQYMFTTKGSSSRGLPHPGYTP